MAERTVTLTLDNMQRAHAEACPEARKVLENIVPELKPAPELQFGDIVTYGSVSKTATSREKNPVLFLRMYLGTGTQGYQIARALGCNPTANDDTERPQYTIELFPRTCDGRPVYHRLSGNSDRNRYRLVTARKDLMGLSPK